MLYTPLPKSFYEQPTLSLAKSLLGQYMVHRTAEGVLVVKIVETEAYQGEFDRAAHSFGNRRTKRTEIMFGEAGAVYTYQMHTHTLMNVVAAEVGTPHAILLRAGEPVDGLELMRKNRGE